MAMFSRFSRASAAGVALALAAAAPAVAMQPPPPSKNRARNYMTLVRDSHAAPDVAACIATGHDLTLHGDYDRLGFTASEIVAAKRAPAPQSEAGATGPLTGVSVAGAARRRKDGAWENITLRCQIGAAEKVVDIALERR
ncbi:BspC domain-containing protein [Camelimonas abortus]|uniref:BspC domain-containing protein n=1 Tax=Camelimonas abortus TaxID=1017184 RepID=A0ABV7LD28_9HYPH